jgi:hypothetical protein
MGIRMKYPLKMMLALLGLLPGYSAAADTDSALSAPMLGLYPGSEFRLAKGECTDCGPNRQTLWYFENESIAIPREAGRITSYNPGLNAQQDIAQWMQNADSAASLPAAIWLGSPSLLRHVRLSDHHHAMRLPSGEQRPFTVVPKIPTNLSYLNQSSWDFYSARALSLRGETGPKNMFTARTIWPMDYTITPQGIQPLQQDESLQTLVQANQGGAQTPYATRVLWQRNPESTQSWEGHAAIGIMLNGAQGDDDEAHGGHFAILTGQVGAQGDWSQWLVNNFYNLDAYGEKGIIAAITPADKYLMDLNSGQSLYRPSYMLVAILKQPDLALQYQAASNRVYQHFYRHDFIYEHAAANCAGISIDTFRTLGWNIPMRGPEGYAKAIAAWFYVAITEKSLDAGRKIYDYLTEEKTRLYPAVAFDAMGHDLLEMVNNPTRPRSPYEQALAAEIEAIVYVHIPQVPTERAFGQAPVYSFDQYLAQAPADRKDWKILPTTPRPFPEALKDGTALEQHDTSPIPWTVGLLIAIVMSASIMITRWLTNAYVSRRRRNPLT